MKKIVLVLSVVNLGLSSLALAQQVRVKPECKEDLESANLVFKARQSEVAAKKKALNESLKRVSDALKQAKKILTAVDGKSILADWKSGKISADAAIKMLNRELLPVTTKFDFDPEMPLFPGVEDDAAKTWHTGKPYRSMDVNGMGVLDILEKTHLPTPGFKYNECVSEADQAASSFTDCVDNRAHVWSEDEDTAKEHCFGLMSRSHAIDTGTCSKREFSIVTKVVARVPMNEGKQLVWPSDKELRDDAAIFAYDGRGVTDPGSRLVEADYLNYSAFLHAKLDAGCFYKKK